jgi:hypothetical protein
MKKGVTKNNLSSLIKPPSFRSKIKLGRLKTSEARFLGVSQIG